MELVGLSYAGRGGFAVAASHGVALRFATWYKVFGRISECGFQAPRVIPRQTCFLGVKLRELSLFVDESGTVGKDSKYYLITLVFHDQADDIAEHISSYERALRSRGLPDISFHASPLMNGNDEYAGMGMDERKKLLAAFFVFARKLPVTYKTFAYVKKEFADSETLAARMRRDVVTFLFDHLESFQRFDIVKIYYDDGQKVVSNTLREAIGYALSKESVLFRKSSAADYRLAQVADFLCTIELTALKYEAKETTPTDDKVFGMIGTFKGNYLKKLRNKLLV
ncbi:MAG: DUF3800 domain-containing protein [Gordonibacter sp.]